MRTFPPPSAASAFSLVEVVLALGICSFAMVAIVGMIPIGLSTFRQAMNTTVQTQIVQGIAGEILQTEYHDLQLLDGDADYGYFNDQGTRLADGSSREVAYTARVSAPKVLQQKGAGKTITPGLKVAIRIAETHPGQSFQSVSSATPQSVCTYSVIVASAD